MNQPDATFVHMRYVDYLIAAPATTALQPYSLDVYRGNSIWDPVYSGTGLTCNGYTWAQSMYKSYCCMGSKITCRLSNVYTVPIIFGILPVIDSNDFTSITTVQQLLAQPYCKWVEISPLSGSASIVTLSSYMSTKKMHAVSDIVSDSDYYSLMGQNPNKQWYWQMFVITAGAVPASSIYYTTKLTYYTKLFERKLLSN